jgi:hypothetical protein
MGTVHLNGPPLDIAAGACPFCLMHAKQVQWEMYQDEITAGQKASGDKMKRIPWPPALDKEIFAGEYLAVPGEAPSLGLVRLCWDHVAGLAIPVSPELIAAQGPVPPGLLKGNR